jgi:hypothetical protein
VGKEELQQILESFQRDKSPGPDGILMEFFWGCYEFIEEDLRRVVEATRTISKILGASILVQLYVQNYLKVIAIIIKRYYQNKCLKSSLGSWRRYKFVTQSG